MIQELEVSVISAPEFLIKLLGSYAEPIWGAVKFILAFLLIWGGGKFLLIPLFDRIMARQKMEIHIRRPLNRVIRVLVTFVALAVAFGFAGYGNFLVTFGGIAAAGTLAIGFATKDLVANFIAGLFIFIDRPFKIGDKVEFGSYSGVVEDISFRTTRIRTYDNELLTVPNSKLSNEVLKNRVAKETIRDKYQFGISYEADLDQAVRIIVEVLESHEEILSDPAPGVLLTGLGDSTVNLEARFWGDSRTANFSQIKADIIKAIKQRFDQVGIEIPYPHLTIDGKSLTLDHSINSAKGGR